MQGSIILSVILVTAAPVAVYFIDRCRQQQKHALLPPGPLGSPHARYSPRTIQSWIEEYGPVISLKQGRDVLVVIGRHNEATQLLEKQGECFADRPHSVAGGDILGRGMRFMLLSTGDRLRRFRKAAHANFQPKVTPTYDVDQITFARNIVVDLLDDPDAHQLHVKRFSGSVALRVVYGKSMPVSLSEDPYLLHLKRMVPVIQDALLPGAYQVDRFPFLQYVPWYGKQLKKWGEEEYQMLIWYMSQYKSGMMSETGPHSVAKEFLTRTVTEGNFSETETAYFWAHSSVLPLTRHWAYQCCPSANMFLLILGCYIQTRVAISTIMMAAARFPDAQAVLHAQLDAVVGRDAAPTFADWIALTELRAFILEALRWRPVNPFGAPRRASKDVFWNGYCIPAGATVYGSHWSIARDPEVFPEPEKFNPKRWMGPDGDINDLKAYSFGFGRRTCVGSNLAIRSLYIASATVFWAFTIAEDPVRPIDDTVFVPGIVSHQKPFSLLFEQRMGVAHLRELIWGSSVKAL